MSNEDREKITDIVSEMWEAEIARLRAALAASNDELELARSNSRAMYNRLNAKNIRISEMDRETIHGLRDENARLRAALKPVLEVALSYESGELINWNDCEVCTDSEYAVSVNCKPIDDHTLAGCLAAVREAQRIYKGVEECEVKE